MRLRNVAPGPVFVCDKRFEELRQYTVPCAETLSELQMRTWSMGQLDVKSGKRNKEYPLLTKRCACCGCQQQSVANHCDRSFRNMHSERAAALRANSGAATDVT